MEGRYIDTSILNSAFVGCPGDSAHCGEVHHGTLGRGLSFPKWKEVARKWEPRKVHARAGEFRRAAYGRSV